MLLAIPHHNVFVGGSKQQTANLNITSRNISLVASLTSKEVDEKRERERQENVVRGIACWE